MLTRAPPVVSLSVVETWSKGQVKVLRIPFHMPCTDSEVFFFFFLLLLLLDITDLGWISTADPEARG